MAVTRRSGEMSLEAVRVPEVGSVRVRRHILDRETARLMLLCKRIGKRLDLWFTRMPEEQVSQYLLRTKEGPMVVPRKDAQDNPIMEPVVPTGDMMETFRWYQTALLGLLKEQRARAAMKPEHKPAMSDLELEAELAAIADEAVRSMPLPELERLLGERKAIDVPVAPAPPPPPEHSAVPEVEPMLDFGDGESDAE